ncbi:MAG TPA: hypothetical protein VJK52_01170 [Candidatus Nanoarchaeia archaeon]|nr:hypothetical protein [Candidatus Nanoarchaeia archaeon]
MKGALVAILFFLAACASEPPEDISVQQNLIDAYNSQNSRIADLVAEHNSLIAKVRETAGNQEEYRAAVAAYTDFVAANKEEFETFGDFVRENESFLKQHTIDTMTLLENLQTTLDTMDQNIKEFTESLSNSTQPSSSRQSRFRTVPLYR